MATPNAVPKDTRASTPPLPDYNDVIVLGAASAETWTVPSNVHWVIIEPTAPIWVSVTTTATVPAADVVDGTASFRMSTPSQFVVSPGQAVSLIRESGASTVSISCWTNNP